MLASKGYPASGPVGLPITGLEAAALDDVLVFHSGTTGAPVARGCGRADAIAGSFGQARSTLTSGGRVLTVVAGATARTAIERAYAGVAKISFEACNTVVTSDERH